MLICEAGPSQSGEGSENNKRRIEEDETGLSNKSVIWNFRQLCLEARIISQLD